MKRLAQWCEVDTHMHSSGLRQWPCSASQPGRHRAATKEIGSLAPRRDKAGTQWSQRVGTALAAKRSIALRTQFRALAQPWNLRDIAKDTQQRERFVSVGSRGRGHAHRSFILACAARSYTKLFLRLIYSFICIPTRFQDADSFLPVS